MALGSLEVASFSVHLPGSVQLHQMGIKDKLLVSLQLRRPSQLPADPDGRDPTGQYEPSIGSGVTLMAVTTQMAITANARTARAWRGGRPTRVSSRVVRGQLDLLKALPPNPAYFSPVWRSPGANSARMQKIYVIVPASVASR
jgi:hypothetical protein